MSILVQEIVDYNKKLSGEDLLICDTLMQIINLKLHDATSKIWYWSPVWFLDGNPVVGYHKLKDCVRLLFWSGQSFDESGLSMEWSFKAAEKRYTSSDQINKNDVTRWLQKAKTIQWDYKNIVKRKWVLEKITEF